MAGAEVQSQERRRASCLCLGAGAVTAGLMVWAVVRLDDPGASWLRWLLTIGIPPMLMSFVAAAQYRWGRGTGAGAAAAVLYWALFGMYFVSAGGLYLFGALLQTASWFVGRARSRAVEPMSST